MLRKFDSCSISGLCRTSTTLIFLHDDYLTEKAQYQVLGTGDVNVDMIKKGGFIDNAFSGVSMILIIWSCGIFKYLPFG